MFEIFLNYFLILIKYKLYIYDVTGSTTDPTSEPWTGNFFASMSDPILKTLVVILGLKWNTSNVSLGCAQLFYLGNIKDMSLEPANGFVILTVRLLIGPFKTLFPCISNAFDFKSKSYQVHHVKINPIRMTRKMVTLNVRVWNYLHHSKSHKRLSIANFLSNHHIHANLELTKDFLDDEVLLVETLSP